MVRDNSRELEIQRRVTEALASAGVGHGRISLECLYMLPPEFSKKYQELFWRGLRENVSRGENAGPRDENVLKKVNADWKPKGKAKKDEKGKVVVGADGEVEKVSGKRLAPGGGGKRYRTYWTVKDEEALKVKASVDRALRRLAGKIDRELRAIGKENQSVGEGEGNVGGVGQGEPCLRCEFDLTLVKELLRPVHYCPRCGEGVK